MLENEYVDKDRYKEIINYKPENNIQRAFRYFFLNRTSFSGIMYKPRWGYRLGSSVTPDKWVKRIIPVADKIQKAKITCLDYKEIIDKDKNDILYYLDPPYYDASRNIYNNEFRNEDHLDLCTLLKDINGKFVLSYNNHEYIKKIYDWANIKSEEWIYFLSENRRNQGKELIITNF